jgi:alkaline phosphatase
MMKNWITICLILTTLQGISQSKPNVILLIGDGMGLSQISAAMYEQDEALQMERFTKIGFIKTHSSKEKVTDSAAGATAFSIGEKTYNGAIGVDARKKAKETILEYLEKNGYNTALVSTSSITHATPASFYAHVESRKMENEIAEFMPSSGVDFFAGGGREFFTGREDGKDVLAMLQEAGYRVSTHEEDVIQADQPDMKYGYLHADDGMPSMLNGRGDFLLNASRAGLNYLAAKDAPFFMMIEGSQIDWGGHANDIEYILTELYDFDEVIGWVLDFAENMGNTLVVVTADHETGGLALTGTEDYKDIIYKFNTGGHSATLIPVFAKGVGEDLFQGIYDNTDIYHKLMEVLQN